MNRVQRIAAALLSLLIALNFAHPVGLTGVWGRENWHAAAGSGSAEKILFDAADAKTELYADWSSSVCEGTRRLFGVAHAAAEENAFSGEALQEAALDSEQCEQLVQALFAAAIGTDTETERAARKGMTEDEEAQRNAENAIYRAQTLPWLKQALSMGWSKGQTDPEKDAFVLHKTEETEGEDLSAQQTEAALTDDLAGIDPADEDQTKAAELENGSEQPVWTAEDGFAVMQTNTFGTQYIALLSELGAEGAGECMALTQEAVRIWLESIDHEELVELNGDYAFWLYGPGTQIDYPVVQGADNAHYLNRLFNGRWNSAGTLFVDYRNLSELQDPNTLVYGHHMRNDSMFGSLTDYEERAYFEAHPYFLVVSEIEICLLEAFAGYTTSDTDHCYDIAISDEEDMRLFVEEAQKKSDFDVQAEIMPGDRLMTLSTCAYAFRNARYIVIGRLTPLWRAAPEGCSE